MKNHELLDMIGEVNEDYVLAAGDNVVKPRFRWQTLAACAACAALVLCAYPVLRGMQPKPALTDNALSADEAAPQLHAYTVVEGGTLATLEGANAPAGGANGPAPDPDHPIRGEGPSDVPGGAYVDSGQGGEDIDGLKYSVPSQDAAVDEPASSQYDSLLRGMGLYGEGNWSGYPAWFAGAWIEGENLVVAIVGNSRTPELEAKIRKWAEGDIVFRNAKYSKNDLDNLMDPVTRALDGAGLACGIGVDVASNCLGVDLYSDGAAVPDSVLMQLAQLDPDGDAIRVRVFTQAMSTLTDEVKKGPAPNAISTPVPGGAQYAEELPETTETEQPAHYDLLPHDE